ncbi:HTH domain-containing protein [Natribaculum luteum]|uniref:HTH domain-containing protein n=1 Tax=Natribaculum luteum TaxID=1586232 RepID=A0ABD5NXD1_9EURY|nr:HTH domain-containing protein [Natribaculum luteum]
MTEANATPSRSRRVELRVRERIPASVADVVDDVVDRLGRLEADGEIAELQVSTWSRRCGTDAVASVDTSVAAAVAEFRSWADRNGYTLRPAFDRRDVSSMVARTSRSELVVPMICLAVYEDDDLQCVAPCSDGDDVFTAADCLAALESDASDPIEVPFENDGAADDVDAAERERASA